MSDFYKTDIAFTDSFVATATGDLELISGLANLKEALLRRLTTQPGTIIHRPNYGVGIQSFMNMSNSIDTKRRIAMKIQEQFEKDDRVESVTGVGINFSDENPEKVEIVVRIKAVGFEETAMTFIPFGEG